MQVLCAIKLNNAQNRISNHHKSCFPCVFFQKNAYCKILVSKIMWGNCTLSGEVVTVQ